MSNQNSETEALFELGRASHSPTSADRARVRAALARRLLDAPVGSAPVRPVRIVGTGKLLKMAFGMICLVAGTYVTVHRTGTQQPVVSPVMMARAPAAEPPSERGEIVEVVPALPAQSREVTAVSPAQSSPRVVKRSKIKHAAPEPTVTAAPVHESTPQVSPPLAAAVTASKPSANQPKPLPQMQPQMQRSAPLEPRDDHGSVRDELAFVTRIHAALRDGQTQNVLKLCAEHQQRWPDGVFLQEREGLRAIAACTAGVAGAGGLARKFVASYPRAPLVGRVRDACAAQH